MYFILVIMTVLTYTQELYKRRVSLTLNYDWAFVNLDNGASASKLELESEELHLSYRKPPTLSWWWLKSGVPHPANHVNIWLRYHVKNEKPYILIREYNLSTMPVYFVLRFRSSLQKDFQNYIFLS